ncbi:MAG TPA: alanine--tRNA ligase [Anaerolineales bacterium]|nr:alanine--tRNA ligase [Anaerolineales bacterium]
MQNIPSAAEIRQTFLDYFLEQGHKFVPSASLVPGGDATLLFTNAGMVQFKDVFLGTEKRDYRRAVNSQKCMRVAGKHNDLDDVGRDDTHHTFFEMLGNWSFGDYYKKEAIAWAWQLLTDVWGLPREKLYATCFQDDIGDIPSDDEAAENWKVQPGMDSSHVLYFGRKDNFWEMAETGPCGPCSEIHIDLGEEYCDLKTVENHICQVNGDCKRFLELWNLVFIQYNRLSPTILNPLPATHVDTGMGFERIVSVLQKVDSNYKTDLFKPALDAIRKLIGEDENQMFSNFTPYRVIADHARAAAFLIADGVVPGNMGRNYVCRMIIRRAARFGTKIGLFEPFLASIADAYINVYRDFYPELVKNRQIILDDLTMEEKRFARTVESGTAVLDGYLSELKAENKKILAGEKAFELYATYGLPLEITRDIVRESGNEVDEKGFYSSMEEHRKVSGAGKEMGDLGGEDAEVYAQLSRHLIKEGKLAPEGVVYNPYGSLDTRGKLLAIVNEGISIEKAITGDIVAVVIPETSFYIESGGQVSDTGIISNLQGTWEIEITGMRKPAPGMIIHLGEVTKGNPKLGDDIIAQVDPNRRMDIMRNHTATHILHEVLHQVIGEHARQAGSLVAHDKLRFDFNHDEALNQVQLEEIEKRVNEAILADMPVDAVPMKRDQAIAEGATALFGEKYGDIVRTIAIMKKDDVEQVPLKYSFELCGGTHMKRTGTIGSFLILSEGSAAAGIRRIEAVTGRASDEIIRERVNAIRQMTKILSSSPHDIVERTRTLFDDYNDARRQITELKAEMDIQKFDSLLYNIPHVMGVSVLTSRFEGTEVNTLRIMCDHFRQKIKSGVTVIGTILNDRPIIMAAVTEDLTKRGIKAGDLVNYLAPTLGGSGGGRPTLAQAGGKDPLKLDIALDQVSEFIESHLDG